MAELPESPEVRAVIDSNEEWSDEEWDAHIEEIAPNVMRVLEGKKFFETLDPRVFPARDWKSSTCNHTFEKTLALISELGFSEDDRDDIMNVLQSRGGFCDCEVLLNAADGEDLPKERYWKEKAQNMKEQA
jgi:Protein of unknown function (DUF2695)